MHQLTTLIQVSTKIPLTQKDYNIIESIKFHAFQWIEIDQLNTLLESEDFIEWLRLQSVNKIESVNTRQVAGQSVVNTWMYDPNDRKVFFTLSKYLYPGDDDRFDCLE